MRYIHRGDQRLMVRDDLCVCGHPPEEHQDEAGACQSFDQASGEQCECGCYGLDENTIPPATGSNIAF